MKLSQYLPIIERSANNKLVYYQDGDRYNGKLNGSIEFEGGFFTKQIGWEEFVFSDPKPDKHSQDIITEILFSE